MIGITAATGQLGRLITDNLLKRVAPAEIVLLAHQPERLAAYAERGVQVRRGDLNDQEPLRAALEGVDRLLFISSPEYDRDKKLAHHQKVVEAAKEAGVGQVAYTSIVGADDDVDGLYHAHPVLNAIYHVHNATEKLLRDSGIAFTFLRNPIYTEAFINPGLKGAVEKGDLVSTSKGRNLNTATRPDLAEAAAVVGATGGHAGKTYSLTGPRWNYPQLAAALSQASGKPVAYKEVDKLEPSVQAWLFDLIAQGGMDYGTNDLENLLGHPATGVAQAVNSIADTLH